MVCRMYVGAATREQTMDLMELSHLIVQHPRGLLRWFLQGKDVRAA